MTLRAFLSRFNVHCSDNRWCTYLKENNDLVRYAKVLVTVTTMRQTWVKIGLRSSEAFLIKGTPSVPNEVDEFLGFDFGKEVIKVQTILSLN